MSDEARRAYESLIDPWTGFYDRQTIRLRIVEEFRRAKRYGYAISIIVVTLPHAEARFAEEHVRQLAEILERHVRKVDILARYEHDTLVLLLPHTDEEGARRLGERVYRMATVMQLPAGLGGRPAPVHVGVTTVPADYTGDATAEVDALWEMLRGAGLRKKRPHLVFVPFPLPAG